MYLKYIAYFSYLLLLTSFNSEIRILEYNSIMKKDPRIDAYIAKSATFAQPILVHLRKVIHAAVPDIQENVKWGMPFFEYNGIVCNMASFKEHCAFGFWKAALMSDPNKLFDKDAMGQLGQIRSIKDLPSDKILTSYIKEAVKLNIDDVKLVKAKPSDKKELEVPAYMMKALKANKKAWKTFEEFSYSNKKEYVEWVTEAKTESTRDKRLETAIEWMSEGKIKNWKYAKS